MIDSRYSRCLSIVLIFLIAFSFIGLLIPSAYAYPMGNTKDLSTGSADSSWSGSGSFYYCFKINDETLTWQYFKDNPDFYITFTPSVDVKFFTEFGKDQVVEVSKGESFILNWDSLNSCFGEYIPADLNYYFYIGYSASAKGYMTMTSGYTESSPFDEIVNSVSSTSHFISELINIILSTIVSHPLLIIVYSISFVALMYWVFKFFWM